MLYYLFRYLYSEFAFPGAGVFEYISFRTAMAVILSLLISLVFGKKFIRMLQRFHVGESIRDLGLEGESEKRGTPTMGGLIIILSILVPVLLFAKLDNVYILLLIFSTLWLGFIGFVDDYIKVFNRNKDGLAGKFKIIGQVVLGIVVGSVMFWHPDVVIKSKGISESYDIELQRNNDDSVASQENEKVAYSYGERSLKTTIPFFKNNQLDYGEFYRKMGGRDARYAFLLFIPIVIFIVVAVSNSANLTDGIDGLATGISAIVAATLALLAWVSGNIIFSDYLNIMYIPNLGEVSIYTGAMVGACAGFLWYNTHPAQVFMGDTGSLTLGGVIAVIAIIIRKELLIPILCGVFLIESLSVILQRYYFKFTRKYRGGGKRIFLMTPLHHHYQLLQYKEQKIVMRFFIVAIIFALLTIITLKIR